MSDTGKKLSAILKRVQRDSEIAEHRRKGYRQSHFAKVSRCLKEVFAGSREVSGWERIFPGYSSWSDLCSVMQRRADDQIAFEFLLAFRNRWEEKLLSQTISQEEVDLANQEAIGWLGVNIFPDTTGMEKNPGGTAGKKQKQRAPGDAHRICAIRIPKTLEVIDMQKNRSAPTQNTINLRIDFMLASKGKEGRGASDVEDEIKAILIPKYVGMLNDQHRSVWDSHQRFYEEKERVGCQTLTWPFWIQSTMVKGTIGAVWEKTEMKICGKTAFYEISNRLRQLDPLIDIDRLVAADVVMHYGPNSTKRKPTNPVPEFNKMLEGDKSRVIEVLKSFGENGYTSLLIEAVANLWNREDLRDLRHLCYILGSTNQIDSPFAISGVVNRVLKALA
jgi:hypothetical protein